MTSGHPEPALLESMRPAMPNPPTNLRPAAGGVPDGEQKPQRRPAARCGPWLTYLVAIIALVTLDPSARANDERSNDKVTLRSATGSGRTTIFGTILNHTGDSITIKTHPRGAVHTYPASRIISVEAAQTSFHIKGLLELAADDIASAQAAFEQALKDETREWMRREILSLLVRCAVRQGDYSTAGSRFLLLVKSDPNTHYFRQIPLRWASRELEAGLENAARGWLEDSLEPARLLGASFLLESDNPDSANAARLELHKLAASPEPRIQQLAQTQRLRLRLANDRLKDDETSRAADSRRPTALQPVAGRLSPDELKSWQSRIESMPQALRGGPYYVLGQAYLQIGDAERGAAALLWIPLIYDDDYQLAARACLEAADALAEVGMHNQAATLYHEVAHRYRQSTFGEQALVRLARQRASRAMHANEEAATEEP